MRFAESLAEQFSASVPGFADALAQVARERSGRSGQLRIEGTATAGTVHPNASLIGVRVTLSHVTADEAFEQLVQALARGLAAGGAGNHLCVRHFTEERWSTAALHRPVRTGTCPPRSMPRR
ncbi:hypothetical protein OG311_35920 [Streptomyces sp. NBC_01343]|uniref:hypothetical protein n=1 Tax=Streptomyces sp. NBC_01343 TaxID=2903832 RepID=UPI002E14E758|nr:hypothetical protein OG311_35920 [Streptomyces sp. NBC_01343]